MMDQQTHWQRMVLGTVQFGLNYGINNQEGQPSAATVMKLLNEAYEMGVRELDTAQGYGESQKRIGDFHQQNPSIRYCVSSKFQVGTESIEVQLHRTLKQLNVESLGTYSFHSFLDLSQPEIFEEAQRDLLRLKKQGKIQKIGASIYDSQQMEELSAIDWIDVVQVPFNLLDNWVRRGPGIKKSRQEVHVRSVYLQGLFYMKPSALPHHLQELAEPLTAIQALANRVGISVGELALRYVLSHEQVSRVLFGVESIDQLRDLIPFISNGVLTSDLCSEIEAIPVQDIRLLDPRNWNQKN